MFWFLVGLFSWLIGFAGLRLSCLALPVWLRAENTRVYRLYYFSCGLLVTGGLIALGIFYNLTPLVLYWQPETWCYQLNIVCMGAAAYALALAWPSGYACTRIRRPLLVALFFWSLGHLFSEGDLTSIVLFGTILLYALCEPLWLSDQRKIYPISLKWEHEAVVAGVGVGIFVFAWVMHAFYAGVPVMWSVG